MALIIVKKSIHNSKDSFYVRISLKTTLIAFCGNFMKQEVLAGKNYVRFAYDAEEKLIAVDFSETQGSSDEFYKLPANGSKAVPSRSILNFCNLKIEDIAGFYEGDALEGPKEIEGFSKTAFILHIDKRKAERK